MGNSLSLSGSNEITTDKLKLSSKDIQTMSDALFKFMYTNWKAKDIMDIANNPSDYVIAISDLITTQFHVIGYTTRTGRIGEIYVEKWDKLEPPIASDKAAAADALLLRSRNSTIPSDREYIKNKRNSRKLKTDSGYETHKQNAKIISFYFIRIFQILGAMLLVVKDVNIPDYDTSTGKEKEKGLANGDREFAQTSYGSQMQVPGFRASTIPSRGLHIGGALIRAPFENSIALGPFEFLRFYLKKISDPDRTRYNEKGISLPNNAYMLDQSDNLFFEFTPPQTIPPVTSAATAGIQRIGIAVTEKGGNRPRIEYLNIEIRSINFGTSPTIQGFLSPSKRDEKDRINSYPRDVSIKISVPGSGTRNSINILRTDNRSSSLLAGIEYAFGTDEQGLVNTIMRTKRLDPTKNFIEILENIVFYYCNSSDSNTVPLEFKEVQNTTIKQDDNQYKTREPKIAVLKPIYSLLVKQEGTPHCISRALQLLDPASINNFSKDSGISKICTSALGKDSKTLDTYTPTRSLAHLYGKINPTDYAKSKEVLEAFVDTGASLSTRGVSNIPGEEDALVSAIKRISVAFNIVYSNQDSFSKLEVAIPSGCTQEDIAKKDGIPIVRGSQEHLNLSSSARQLLAYHLKYIIEISKFLKKIFNISQRPDGSWMVEGPKTELLFAGFKTLDNLTNQARTILLDYYSGCEELYQRGVKKWSEGRKAASDSNERRQGQVLPTERVVDPVSRAPNVPRV